MAAELTTEHGSAVLVGAKAVLIRGPSGAGKSRLAFELIEAARVGALRFARLVADDRVYLETAGGRLLARAPEPLYGLIEVHGVGILRLPYEPRAAVGLVVDLAAEDAERFPQEATRKVEMAGIVLPRLAVAPGAVALPQLLALLTSAPGRWI